MRIALAAFFLTLAVGGAALAATPAETAGKLMGGDAFRNLRSISATLHVTVHSNRESVSSSDPAPLVQDSVVKVTQDLRGRQTRLDWTRSLPERPGPPLVFSEIFNDRGGFVTAPDGPVGLQPAAGHMMSGMRLVTALREQGRLQIPAVMALDPGRFAPARPVTVGGVNYAAMSLQGRTSLFTVLFDPKTRLPFSIQTHEFDGTDGDSVYEVRFEDWSLVTGLRLPTRYTYYLNGVATTHVEVSDIRVNPPVDAGQFLIPSAAPPPADPRKVPWQWVLWQQYFGHYLDSDRVWTLDDVHTRDLAPGFTFIFGGSHNAVIIETPKYLAVVDAPVDDGFAKWIIAAARKRYPKKPIKYLLLTHAHEDHIGGLRTFAAQGVTIVVGKGLKGDIEHMLAAPTKLDIYAPGVRPKAAKIMEVDRSLKLTDGGREIDAYAFDTPHAKGTVVYNVPEAGFAYTADVNLAPGPDMAAEVQALRALGVSLDKVVDGHGPAIRNWRDIVRQVDSARLKAASQDPQP